MATVIDSLVVALNLDPTNFVKGSKDVQNAYAKTKDEAVKSSKQVEESTSRLTQSIAKVSATVLGLFAVLLGGRGFQEFISDTNSANLALGRFSAQLGVSPKWVGEFEQVVKRVGGSADEARAALTAANQAVQDFALGKGVPEAISRMTARVGGSVNFASPTEYIKTLAPILQRYAEIDAAQEKFFAQQLGLAESVNAALIEQGKNLQANMDKLADRQPTDKAIKAAQDLQKAWADLELSVSSLGSSVTEKLNGPLITAFSNLSDILQLYDTAFKGGDTKKFFDGSHPGVTGGTTPESLAATNQWIKEKLTSWIPSISSWLPSFTSSQLKRDKLPGSPGDKPFYGASPAPVLQEGRSAYEGDDGFVPPGQQSAQPIKVGSSEVSTGNPLPVTIVSRGAAGGFWDWLTGGSGSSSGGGGSGGGGSGGGPIGVIKRLLGVGDDSGAGSPDTAYSSGIGNLTALIEAAAKKHGINPDIMEGIRAGESLHTGRYDKKDDAIESSWGPFQLNRRRGLGVQFEKETGLDLRNPNTIAAQADWVASYLARGGSLSAWAGYHGNRKADPKWGDSGYNPTPSTAPSVGGYGATDYKGNRLFTNDGHLTEAGRQFARDHARAAGISKPNLRYHMHGLPSTGAAAALNNISNSFSASSDSSINNMHIGAIHVNAPNATDAQGIANNIQPVLSRNYFAQYANGGPM
jgi:hypothetical protein